MIQQKYLEKEYILKRRSVHEIAANIGCSDNKVTYWLKRYKIDRRTISAAIYNKHNPDGDPFTFVKPENDRQWFLYGLGLGLFWGEGNKMNKNSVRLGNTDPDLVVVFLEFLNEIYKIDNSKLSFGIQIFSDISKSESLKFWQKKLKFPETSFRKVIVTESNKRGSYRHKNQHGVLTVYFHNTKLRDSILSAINELRGKPM